MHWRKEEKLTEIVLKLVGLFSVVVLLMIAFFLFKESFKIFYTIGTLKLISGTQWYPTAVTQSFGMLPLIAGTISTTMLTALFAIPLGIATAVYIAEIASHNIKEFLKPIVEMLASFPSVVFGFFGMVIIAPVLTTWLSPLLSDKLPTLIRGTGIPFLSTVVADLCYDKLFIASGLNMFTASVMLSAKAIPVIASIAEDSIASVPRTFREASYSIGATKWDTIRHVVIPSSLSGISVAIILGFATIVGETMIVLMAAGGAAIVPNWIFDAVRPMPAAIAAEMAEAPYRSLHYHALFGVGVLLFVFNFILSLISDFVSKRFRKVKLGEKL
ncbi:phosphate ABC transporter permease subunit PstC [Candidatus Magnetominusculus dajiuhuensis]|uniref:phosphate ABC transporter permease subunit PstC n=1 Tax=Candidatus Magnetominusculus dajiuhuensis TaxID=3137712 RepID=UPI003B428008